MRRRSPVDLRLLFQDRYPTTKSVLESLTLTIPLHLTTHSVTGDIQFYCFVFELIILIGIIVSS